MNGTDGFLDIHDSHLRVLHGNIHAKSIVLDQLDITSSNTTTSTVQFLNTNKAFKTTANIEVGNANLFVDTSTSNVGILTSTPTHTLDVRGTANVEVLRTTSNIEMNGGTFSLGGHMIPTTHEQYDIGTAEKKIRHLFLSDNSLWIGDKAKISYDNTGDKLTFHKRKASDTFIPAKIIQLANASGQGLDTTIAIQNDILGKTYTPGNLGAMKLHHWLQYAKEFQSNIGLSDIFTSTESDYDSMSTAEGLENVPGASNGELYTTRKVRIGSSVAPTANLDIEGTLKVSGTINGYTKVSASGGTESTTSAPGYKIHTFTSDGTFTVTTPGLVEYLIVAGGGSGGAGRNDNNTPGSGGGGGGVLMGDCFVATGSHTVEVGAGGTSVSWVASTGASGNNGENSSFNGIVAIGGGGGRRNETWSTSSNGGSGGGCGGGGSYLDGGIFNKNNDPGRGIIPQGNDGGRGHPESTNASGNNAAGGGGGAGSRGYNAYNTVGGNGGDGVTSTISGSSVTYAGGGGGSGPSWGYGGSGGGGNGINTNGNASPGTDGLGGGGGGQRGNGGGSSGAGGSGIVIIRYLS